MKRWPTATLGEIAGNGQYGLNAAAMAEGTGVRFIRITDISGQGTLRHEAPAYVPNDTAELDDYELNDGDVLIARSGATAGKSYIHRPFNERAVFAGYLIRFQPDVSKVVPGFVGAFLKTPQYWRQLNSHKRAVAQPNVNAKQLASLVLPLPPLAEQERLVKLLDEADALRMLRAQADRRTADLIPAIFHEMFGVPFGNANPYPVKKLSELIRQGDKINYGVVQPGDDVPDGIPIVRAGDFKGMSIDQRHLKRISPEIEKNYSRSRLQGDEILITCVGSIGNVALADPSLIGFNIVRAVARVPLHNEINRVFVANQLITPELQKYFRQETRTVTQPTLNIRQIEETPIILPPFSLQMKFAERVTEIRALEAEQAASRRGLDDLFQSMLHRAFSGEL